MKINRIGGMALMVLALTAFLSCATTQPMDETAYTNFQQRMADGHYFVEAQSAQPMMTRAMAAINSGGLTPNGSSVSRIQLSGGYGIRMYQDSISVDLPYYGERWMAGSPNPNDAGIRTHGRPENFQVLADPDRKKVQIRFDMDQGMERLNFMVELFPNDKATIQVLSSQRLNIRYDAEVRPLEEDKAI